VTSSLPPITRKLGVTPRIRALASFVPPTTRVFVDIGTNHAILPIAVLREQRAMRCIGIDKSASALEDAQRRLRRCHALDRVELRIGDGLEPLTRDEVDTICIAGVGPRTVAAILTDGLPLMKEQEVRLVLNPFGGSAETRTFLAEHGFALLADTEVMDRGRTYTILVAQRGASRLERQL
jgi:tRNA (adenine22-N1)-methyltransferase